MKSNHNRISSPSRWILFLLLSILAPHVSTAWGQTTVFTYQGRLTDGGNPAQGLYDLSFTLFDGPMGGSAVGGPQTLNAVSVNNGLFTVTLNFNETVFAAGADRWLEIGGRASGVGDFTTLTPRQQITSAPYAITARSITGNVTASQVPSLDASKITSGAFGPSQIPDLDSSKITAGTLAAARIPASRPAYRRRNI